MSILLNKCFLSPIHHAKVIRVFSIVHKDEMLILSLGGVRDWKNSAFDRPTMVFLFVFDRQLSPFFNCFVVISSFQSLVMAECRFQPFDPDLSRSVVEILGLSLAVQKFMRTSRFGYSSHSVWGQNWGLGKSPYTEFVDN